jgi:hypothetical protein
MGKERRSSRSGLSGRRTAITNRLANSMRDNGFMATINNFYSAAANDLVDRARLASANCVDNNLLQIFAAAKKPSRSNRSRPVKVCQPQTYRTRPAGFEPATYGLEIRCSIRLSYGRKKHTDPAC